MTLGFTLNIIKGFPKPRIMGSGDGFGAKMSWDPRHSFSYCRRKSVKTTLWGTFHVEKSPEQKRCFAYTVCTQNTLCSLHGCHRVSLRKTKEVKTAPWWFSELTMWLHIYIYIYTKCIIVRMYVFYVVHTMYSVTKHKMHHCTYVYIAGGTYYVLCI